MRKSKISGNNAVGYNLKEIDHIINMVYLLYIKYLFSAYVKYFIESEQGKKINSLFLRM